MQYPSDPILRFLLLANQCIEQSYHKFVCKISSDTINTSLLTCISYSFHFIYIVSFNNWIKSVVEFIQKIHNFHRRTETTQRRKTNNVTEEYCARIECLCFNWVSLAQYIRDFFWQHSCNFNLWSMIIP